MSDRFGSLRLPTLKDKIAKESEKRMAEFRAKEEAKNEENEEVKLVKKPKVVKNKPHKRNK